MFRAKQNVFQAAKAQNKALQAMFHVKQNPFQTFHTLTTVKQPTFHVKQNYLLNEQNELTFCMIYSIIIILLRFIFMFLGINRRKPAEVE